MYENATVEIFCTGYNAPHASTHFSVDQGRSWGGNMIRISSMVTQAYTASPLVRAFEYREASFTTMGRAVFVQRVT